MTIAIPGRNGFEKAGRLSKTMALLTAFDKLITAPLDPVTHAAELADMLQSWGPAERASLALCAAVHPPSDETWATLVMVVRGRSE